MRSASTVVLRRDLSLSRRLYTWLLGSDDNPDSQVAHLRTHGLDLLRKSLTVRYLVSLASNALADLVSHRVPTGRDASPSFVNFWRSHRASATLQDLHLASGQVGDRISFDGCDRRGRVQGVEDVVGERRRRRCESPSFPLSLRLQTELTISPASLRSL